MSDAWSVSPSDVAEYVTTFGVTSFQQELLLAKKRRNIAELMGFAEVIISDLPDFSERSGFGEYFQKLKQLKTGAILKSWSTPGGYHWCAVTQEFLDVLVHGTAPSAMLDHYLTFLETNLHDGFVKHLHDLGRFLIAASLIAQKPVTFDHPVTLQLPSTLPGTGIALTPASGGRRDYAVWALSQQAVDALARLPHGETIECSMFIANGTALPVALKLPQWVGQRGTLVVDGFEPCLNLPSVEPYPRIHSVQQMEQFDVVQRRAFDHLDAFDPELLAELSSVVGSVTLMDTSSVDAEMCSGSASAMFGACFFAVTDEPLYVAEMLLHEFCHNKLRLLQDFVNLLIPEQLGPARFYSPWRDDPRPIDGILHGLFVFSTIARFWLSIEAQPHSSLEARQLARRRAATLGFQLDYALAEFSANAPLTPAGESYLASMSQNIAHIRAQMHSWSFDALLPLYSGVLRAPELRMLPVATSLPRHRELWQLRHQSA